MGLSVPQMMSGRAMAFKRCNSPACPRWARYKTENTYVVFKTCNWKKNPPVKKSLDIGKKILGEKILGKKSLKIGKIFTYIFISIIEPSTLSNVLYL